MNCLDFDAAIAGIVADVRARKIQRMAAKYFPPRRKKRKPRFCVTTTLQLCPRQRESKKFSDFNS